MVLVVSELVGERTSVASGMDVGRETEPWKLITPLAEDVVACVVDENTHATSNGTYKFRGFMTNLLHARQTC